MSGGCQETGRKRAVYLGGAAGSQKVSVVPRPTWLLASTPPPIARVSPRTIARPKPLPPGRATDEIDVVEAVKNVRQVFGCNARSGIHHPAHHALPFPVQAHLHLPA